MNVWLKTALTSLLAFTAMSATAGAITVGTTSVSAPSVVENFDGPTPVDSVSDQFTRSGLMFQTLSGTGAGLIDNDQCNNRIGGMSGTYVYVGVVTPCDPSIGLDGVSIKFASAVSELSWTGFTSYSSEAGFFTLTALNNGIAVSSAVFNRSNSFYNKTVLLTGSVFDELRIVEGAAGYQFMAIDNMAWKVAAVPLPGSLPLLAIGLLGLGAIRRKVRKT